MRQMASQEEDTRMEDHTTCRSAEVVSGEACLKSSVLQMFWKDLMALEVGFELMTLDVKGVSDVRV